MRYLFGLLVVLCICSCECEESSLSCDDGVITFNSNFQSDSIDIVIPNILLMDELEYNIISVVKFNSINPAITSYEFSLTIDDSSTPVISHLDFVTTYTTIAIPHQEIFQHLTFRQGYADFSLKLDLEGASESIEIRGQWLLSSCAQIDNGEIDISDCRYSYNLISPIFGSPFPSPCD